MGMHVFMHIHMAHLHYTVFFLRDRHEFEGKLKTDILILQTDAQYI